MMCQAAFLLLTGALLGASAEVSQEPCCKTCGPGLEKYYSVPDQKSKNPQCGECCLMPSRYHFWKIFESKLLKGDCATQGYTKYTSTETDGFGPLAVTNDRYVHDALSKTFCPEELQAVYADMHDGDKKEITISGNSMTIKPSGNNQTWIVKSVLDRKSCSAVIDFNVPGKPGPPPVNLTATLWYSLSAKEKKTEFEFTDPSGTLAAKSFPLNRWVELSKNIHKGMAFPCPSVKAVFADMHDGDKKEVVISGSSLMIKPSGNSQKWSVNSEIDAKSCSAVIDFNVPGKPGPPPVNLTATLLYSFTASEKKVVFEFTDPSGTLAAADFPLNKWVKISDAAIDVLI